MKSLLVCIISTALLSSCAYQQSVLAEKQPASQGSNGSTVIQPPTQPYHMNSTSHSSASGVAAKMISPIVQ